MLKTQTTTLLVVGSELYGDRWIGRKKAMVAGGVLDVPGSSPGGLSGRGVAFLQ